MQAREERRLARLVEVRVGVALLPRRDLPPTAALSARPRDHSRVTTNRRLIRSGPERARRLPPGPPILTHQARTHTLGGSIYKEIFLPPYNNRKT